MPGAPPQKPQDHGDDVSSLPRLTPVTPVHPSVGRQPSEGSEAGDTLGDCNRLDLDNDQLITVSAPQDGGNSEAGKLLLAGTDPDEYGLVLPPSCRSSVASEAFFPASESRSAKNSIVEIAAVGDFEVQRPSSDSGRAAKPIFGGGPEDRVQRPSILTNKELRTSTTAGIKRRIQEATKVVRLVSIGSLRERSNRKSTEPNDGCDSDSTWQVPFDAKRSSFSNGSSIVSEKSSMSRWAKPVRSFFKGHRDEYWWTYLFGHSLSEAANMRRLGNKSPDDQRLIHIMTAMNELKSRRQDKNKESSFKGRRGGASSQKARQREEEDAATMLRDSSIHWSYFDIFEKDIGDENMQTLRMIRAFSRFAVWSRTAAKTICMWSIWYSTCLFFFWDVLENDPHIGSTTPCWHLLQAVDIFFDLVFLCITFSRLVTTIADVASGVEICLPERVVWKVLNSVVFWVDLLTCFPWTLTSSAAPSVFPRWLMLIKTARGWHIFERSHTWLVFQQDLNTIPLLISYIFLGGHVLACVYYYLILDGIPVLDRDKMFPEWSFVQCYMYSYRICVYLLLGEDMEDLSSTGEFYDVNLGRLGYTQDLFVVFCMPVGSLINALVFSQIIVIVQRRSALETIHIEHENQLRQTMISYDLPSSLQLRMLAYYKYEKIHQAHATFGTIFKNLSPQLNFELRLFLYYEQVTGVPLFESCQPRVLRELVLRLNDRLFLPGDYICRFGDKGEEMYFICKGSCSVIAEDMTHVLAELGPGGHFGEIAVIMGQKRTAYVRANGFCLTASLSKDNFEEIMKEFPEELRVILSKMSSEKKQQIQDIGRNSISAGQHGLKLAVPVPDKSRRDSNADTADEGDEESSESSSSSAGEHAEEDDAPGELPVSATVSLGAERKEGTEASDSASPDLKPEPKRRPSVLKRSGESRESLKPRMRSVSILETAQVHHHSDDCEVDSTTTSNDGKRRVSFANFDTQHLMHDIHEKESNQGETSSEDADSLTGAPISNGIPLIPHSLSLPNVEAKVEITAHAPVEKEAKSAFGGSRWSRIQNAFNFRSGTKDLSAVTEPSMPSTVEPEAQKGSVEEKNSEEPLVVDEVTEATPASSSTAPATEATPASSSTAPLSEAASASSMAPVSEATPASSSTAPAPSAASSSGSTPREAWPSGPGVSGFGALGGAGSPSTGLWASPRQRPAGGRRISVANHSMAGSPRPTGLRRISLQHSNSASDLSSKLLETNPSGPLASLVGLQHTNRQPMLSSSPRGSMLDENKEIEGQSPADSSTSGAGDFGGAALTAGGTGSTAASSSDAPAGASTMDGEANPQKVSALLDAGGFGDSAAERAGEAPSDSADASDETHREMKRRSTLTVPPGGHGNAAGKHRLGSSSKRASPTSSNPVRPLNRGALLSQHSSPTGTHSSPSDSQTTGSLCLSSGVQSATLAADGSGAPDATPVPAAPEEEELIAKSHQEVAAKMDREVALGKREAEANLGAQLKTLNKAVDELVDVQLKVGRCIKNMEQDSEDLEKALYDVRSLWQAKSKALQRDDALFQEVLEDIKLHVEAAHEGVELLLEDVRGELDNHEIDLAAQAMNIVNSQNEQDSRPHTPVSAVEPEPPRRRKSSLGGLKAENKAAGAQPEGGKDGRRDPIPESRSEEALKAEQEKERKRRPSMRESRPGTPGQDGNDLERRRSFSAAGQRRSLGTADAAAARSNVVNMVL